MIPLELQLKFQEFMKTHGFKVVLVSTCTIVALTSLLWMPKNNPIEVAAEKEIELLTGFNIDFTPDGPTAPPPPEMPKGMNGPAGPM